MESLMQLDSFPAASSNSTATVYVKFKDAAGNESSCINDSIIHDNTAPTSTTISINSGSSYTNSTSITLSLSAVGASQMYITNDSSCTSGGSYEPYATSKVWTLAQTNSTATVYVKFKDLYGNVSACVSDSIIQDGSLFHQLGSSYYENCNSVIIDNQSNIICAGKKDNSGYIIKLGQDGSNIWEKSFGSIQAEFHSVKVDSLNNLYIAGYTWTSNSNLYDSYIIKLDSSGNTLWETKLGVNANSVNTYEECSDKCNDIAIDSQGDLFCAGYSDCSTVSYTNYYISGQLLKLSGTTGDILWDKIIEPSLDNTNSTNLYGVVVDSLDNVYVSGYSTGDFAEVKAGSFSNTDIIMQKTDTNGVELWRKQFGSITSAGGSNSGNEACLSLAIDSNDYLYCGGYSDGDFAEENGSSSYGWATKDAIILKVDLNGNFIWAKQIGSATTTADSIFQTNAPAWDDQCNSISIDKVSGNIVCAGFVQANFTESPAGSKDVSVYMLDYLNGNVNWFRQFGTNSVNANVDRSGSDECNAVATSTDGKIICAGNTAGQMFSSPSNGSNDIILIKINNNNQILEN
jgi:hypothetical protein